MTSTMDANSTTTGSDAIATVDQVLQQYGLQSLSQWAWSEITNGASSNQVVLDMYNQPAFKARFPGIAIRQQKGLPAVSPADYVNYEDALAQMQSQYGLPKGFLTDPTRVANLIGGDVSTSEVQARVEQGYQAVAYAPPSVRQSFAQMFGANGDGALASQFLDQSTAAPLLEQQATAADIAGLASQQGVNMGTDTAMQLAAQGQTGSSTASGIANIAQSAPLFDQSVSETNDLRAGVEGVQAQFGLSGQATQEITQRQQQRAAEFKGGGSPYTDQFGAEGAGNANPV